MSRVNNRTKKKIYRRSRVVISRRKKKQKNEKKILKGGGDGEKEVFFYEGLKITPEEHLEIDGWTRKNDNDNDNSWYVKGTNINDNNKYMLVSSKPKYEETINNKLEEYKNNPDKRLLEAAVAVARAEARLKFLNMIKKEKENEQKKIIADQENIINNQIRTIEQEKRKYDNEKKAAKDWRTSSQSIGH